MLGLRLLEEGHVTAGALADLLGRVVQADAPDDLLALEECLLEGEADLAPVLDGLERAAPYVPVDCRGCGGRFRAPSERLGPSACCPLCEEPVVRAPAMMLSERGGGAARKAAETAAAYPLIGAERRFAHFELMELVGRGGAGQVYRARNCRSDRAVAVKVLDFRPSESAGGALERLRREARAASSVRHAHIVPVFDIGIADGLPYIEMELVRGPSLERRIRRDGMLPAAEACRLCRQALEGLGEVHRRRIVHGDVKPANILIDPAGTARLTDFGISRFLEETTTFTSGGCVMGSPHFMAPEQWRGEPIEPATDLYAMGLVLYHALTGRLPYGELAHAALMYKHLHEPLIAPGEPCPSLPDYLADVVRRATSKRPAERFAEAQDFAAALRLFEEGRAR